MQKISFVLLLLSLFAISESLGISRAEYERQFKRLQDLSKEKSFPYQLVSNMKTEYVTIANTIKKSNIEKLNLLGIPSHAVAKFKAALWSQTAVSKSFNIELFPTQASVIEGLGVVEIEGDSAKIYYAEAHTKANLIQQKVPQKRRSCSGALWWRKCRNWIEMIVRGFTQKELDIIKRAVTARAANDLKTRVENLMKLHAK